MNKLVSIVVPARNAADTLEHTLESLVAQDYPHLEIIVVDDNSTDNTGYVVTRFARSCPVRLHLLVNAGVGTPAALNTGLAAAQGSIVVRVDAHCTIPANYVSLGVSLLGEHVGSVGGSKVPIGVGAVGNAIASTIGSPFAVGDSPMRFSAAPRPVQHVPYGIFHRDVLVQLGGWSEQWRVNQDVELDCRLRAAGYTIFYHPGLVTRWRIKNNLKKLARQFFRYGTGRAKTALSHPSSLSARHFVPPAFVLYLASVPFLMKYSPRWAWAGIPLYGAFLGYATSTLTPKMHTPLDARHVPLVLATIHLAWGSGLLAGLVAALPGSFASSTAKPSNTLDLREFSRVSNSPSPQIAEKELIRG